jgi:hypothetical protein
MNKGKRKEWFEHFEIDAGPYGKLICSYDPTGVRDAFEDYFAHYLMAGPFSERTDSMQASIHLYSNAYCEFLSGFRTALRDAIEDHFRFSVEKTKNLYSKDSVLIGRLEGKERYPITGLRSDEDGSKVIFPEVCAEMQINSLLKNKKRKIKKQFGIADKRGGKRWQRDYLATENELRAFVNRVEELKPAWRMIKKWFRENEYEPSFIKDIQNQNRFKELTRNWERIPTDVLKLVFNRKDSKGRKNWPIAFALEHARIEFRIKSKGFDALYTAYKEGRKLLPARA